MVDVRPLRVPPYSRLFWSNVVTSIGSQLTIVAVPTQVYDLTGSSGYVGLAGGVALVPLLLFGLWGGAIADAVDRRTLLLISNGGIAVTSVLFWLQAALSVNSVSLVLALLGLQQVFFAVNQPTRSAAIARLVPAELLPAAGALNGTVVSFGAAYVTWPADGTTPYMLSPTFSTRQGWEPCRVPYSPPYTSCRHCRSR